MDCMLTEFPVSGVHEPFPVYTPSVEVLKLA